MRSEKEKRKNHAHSIYSRAAGIDQRRAFLKGIQLIRRLGVKRTTVEKLTRECGIAKGSFYLFYPSKEEYLMALAEYASGRADGR